MVDKYISSFALPIFLFTQLGKHCVSPEQMAVPTVDNVFSRESQTAAPSAYTSLSATLVPTVYTSSSTTTHISIGGTYGIVKAWSCDSTEMVTHSGRVLPVEISQDKPFSQGALIEVCVALDDKAYASGIELKELVDFHWVRDDWTNDDFPMDDWIDDEHVQSAIENGRSANGLTIFRKDDCIGKDWCSFRCILEADFYVVPGQVYGYGVAILGYDHQQVEEANATEESLFQEEFSNALFNITIDVEPKDRQPQRKIFAWLCDPPYMEARGDRFLPKRIPECHFRQGDWATVCIAVDDESYKDGIVISNVTDFYWTNWDEVGIDDVEITQEAITDGNASENTLTRFRQDVCSGRDWCTFSSTLFSKFFQQTGNVYGYGEASMEYRMKYRNKTLDAVFEVRLSVQNRNDRQEVASSNWFSTHLSQCRDYEPGYDENNFAKYYSTTCLDQSRAYTMCRAMDKDCRNKCPPVDFETVQDTFPAALAQKFMMTLANATLTSPHFCNSFMENVCADFTEETCCCKKEVVEWQDCLIAQDFPDMFEQNYPNTTGQAQSCIFKCELSESEIRETFSNTNIVVGAVVTVVVISVLALYIYHEGFRTEEQFFFSKHHRSNINATAPNDEGRVESNETGREHMGDTASVAATDIIDDGNDCLFEGIEHPVE